MARKKNLRRRLMGLTRPLRHGLLWLVIESLRRLVCLLSHRGALGLGRTLGILGWWVAWGPRRVAQQQLLSAGVATDATDARRLSRECFQSLGMNMVEWFHSTGWSDAQFLERVAIDPQPVSQLLAEGRGLVVVMGHLGNFEVFWRASHAGLGRKLYAIMAPQRSPLLTQWLVRQRERSGDKLIMTGGGAIGLVRLLRRGELISILIDQDSTRARGEFIDFFGQPALTPTGAGLLAHLAGSPVLPCCIYRRADRADRHQVVVGEPIRPDPQADPEQDARRILEEATRWLEMRIRQQPAQWVWVHQRWRRRPGQPIKIRGVGRKPAPTPGPRGDQAN